MQGFADEAKEYSAIGAGAPGQTTPLHRKDHQPAAGRRAGQVGR